ncbi:hypothetical protein MCOR29_008492 [Pyricularia oryzae]|nr:hypothetical protein MCOR26_009318 [Pyricularia oryzae]KAI6310794.1 hypothetical protein MCOR29_008492 [Pyricularia oryzae]KAI6335748.1 hypothetical protein MCOR28_009526 [Pyricularia oryzae]KAI6357280.1 hypothetical protein MCOR32_009768 [Pyricularia oryzae]KAI6415022.1 hypothetical protein MCOR20_001851 [Pyricularia oryzae]
MALTSFFLGLAWFAITVSSQVNLYKYDTPDLGFQYQPEVTHYWGQFSPFFSVPSEYNASSPLPGCKVTFAQTLSRHGARFPTRGKNYAALLKRIQSSVTKYGRGYEFIRNYKYNLSVDQLNDLGRQQMVNAGIHFYRRYHSLARSNQPFIRYDGQQRVVESGQKWAHGFHLAYLADESRVEPDTFPYKMVEIPHGKAFNNTLSNKRCANFDKSYAKALRQATGRKLMRGIRRRLNKNLRGANLSTKEAHLLMELCPMETAANFGKTGALSPFCSLFRRKDWKAFDHYSTVVKWFASGDGNPLGPTLGVGWVNELIARLLQRPVEDHTSTNSTLATNPATFPLTSKLYADFTHVNDLLGIYSALGLFKTKTTLSNTKMTTIPVNRIAAVQKLTGYSASRVASLGARMYVEKMTCEGEQGELVRILINDRVMRLPNCGADKEGRCKLGAFIQSLSFARAGGHWDKCFSHEQQHGQS